MTESSQAVHSQTHSRMLASSPSSVAWEGKSAFTTSDSLSSDIFLNLSADSITQSWFSSSLVRWSAHHERASSLAQCHHGLLMSNPARNKDQCAFWQLRFWDVQKYVRFLWSLRISIVFWDQDTLPWVVWMCISWLSGRADSCVGCLGPILWWHGVVLGMATNDEDVVHHLLECGQAISETKEHY